MVKHFRAVDVGFFSNLFGIKESQTDSYLRDGRHASTLAEYMSENMEWQIQGCPAHFVAYGGCVKGTDGRLLTEDNRSGQASVKTIAKTGIKFQMSKYVGSGRSCSRQDLLESIGFVNYYIVCDVTSSKGWTFYQVLADDLKKAVELYELDTDGWSQQQFLNWYNRLYPSNS